MMTILGSWFGFSDNDDSSSSSSSVTTTPSSSSSSSSTTNKNASSSPRSTRPGIVITSSSSSSSSASSSPSASASPNAAKSAAQTTPLRKTKSDELLRDFEVMRFLSAVDERLKVQRCLLTAAQLDRLQTLHAQAVADDCLLLTDIIDHFELEHFKLGHRLASNSAAVDAARFRCRNMLVY